MELHKSVVVPFHTILVYEFMLYEGKSYRDLAEALGEEEDYAIDICNGSRIPDKLDIANLATFLNISAEFVEDLVKTS